jgi:hypothetical protein
MSRSTGQCPSDSFSLTFVHCCGHILLTGVQLISFFFRYNRNFKGGHFYAIGWYVHHLIARFLPWSLNLGHRPVLVKEFHSAPVHPPPPVSSLGPSASKVRGGTAPGGPRQCFLAWWRSTGCGGVAWRWWQLTKKMAARF